MQAGQKGSALQQVTPRTIVIPNNFYGSYEALAMRLSNASAGTRFADLRRAGRRGVRDGRSDQRSAVFDADRTDRAQAGRPDLLDAAGLDGRRAVGRRAQSPRANRDSGAVARRIARRSLVGDDARGVHEECRRLDALHSEQRLQPRRHGDDAGRRRGESARRRARGRLRSTGSRGSDRRRADLRTDRRRARERRLLRRPLRQARHRPERRPHRAADDQRLRRRHRRRRQVPAGSQGRRRRPDRRGGAGRWRRAGAARGGSREAHQGRSRSSAPAA